MKDIKLKKGQRPPEDQVFKLMDKMADYTWTMGMDMRFNYVSPAVEQILGYTPEEMMEIPMEELVPPSSLEKALSLLEAGLDAEREEGPDPDRSDTMEMELIKKDGSTIWTEITVRFLRDEKGEPTGLLGITKDITSRKRAEEGLKRKTLALNERVKEINGLYNLSKILSGPKTSIEQVLSKTLDVVPESFRNQEQCCCSITLDGKKYTTPNCTLEEHPFLASDIKVHDEKRGEIRVGYSKEVPTSEEGPFLLEERALVDAFAQMLADFIERMDAGEAIKESEGRYKKLFESSPDGIAIIDQEGVVENCNPGLLSIFDMAREDIVGKNFMEIIKFDEDALGAYLEMFEALLEGKDIGSSELNLTLPNGDELWVEVYPALLRKGGMVTHIQAVLRDITVRKREEFKQMSMVSRLQEEKDLLEKKLRPQYETKTEEVGVQKLEQGQSYIILEKKLDMAARVFQDHVFSGYQGLIISRQKPSVLRKELDLEKTPIIWLTTNEHRDEVCIKPSSIPKLSTAITTFLDKSVNGLVLLTGLEYLLTQNGFRQIINLLYMLNDKIMTRDDTLLISINSDALLPQEINTILAEFTVVESSLEYISRDR